MKYFIFLFLLLMLSSCKSNEQLNQNPYEEPTHNFSVMRLIIVNENGEVLMGKEDSNWYTLALVYKDRQFIKESLDSLAGLYGITIFPPELRGYFSYKYEYHPYATLRSFYVAKYKSGSVKPHSPVVEMKWMSIDEAVRRTPVESMKEATKQIFDYPDQVWGGSFVVYIDGEAHRTRKVEDFYPLFSRSK